MFNSKGALSKSALFINDTTSRYVSDYRPCKKTSNNPSSVETVVLI